MVLFEGDIFSPTLKYNTHIMIILSDKSGESKPIVTGKPSITLFASRFPQKLPDTGRYMEWPGEDSWLFWDVAIQKHLQKKRK